MNGPSVDISFLKNTFEICKAEECKDSGVKVPRIKTGERSEKTCVISIFKFDSKCCVDKYFQKIKVADCGIFLKYQNELYCFIVELKSGEARPAASDQIISTYHKLKKLQKDYNEKKSQKGDYSKKKSQKEVRLIGIIYAKKTSKFVKQRRKENKEQYRGKKLFINPVKVERLRNKNLKLDQVVSIFLDEDK